LTSSKLVTLSFILQPVIKQCYEFVLYLSIYIALLNSHGQTEALLVQLAPRKETTLGLFI